MQIGIDSFVETIVGSGRSPAELDAQRVRELLEEIELADRTGVDVYGIGEHHRAGILGLPLTVAIISGEPQRFRPLIDLYREAGRRADTAREAADVLWPACSTTVTRIGRERGWPPTTRAAFNAQCSEEGAFFVGDPDTVTKKMGRVSDTLLWAVFHGSP